MIPRYTRPEMEALWTLEAKFDAWLEVEIAALQAHEDLGNVPSGITAEVKSKARYEIPRIDEIELEVRHDVIAFLTNVAEHVGEASRFVHLGMTSSDLIDTALSVQIQRAGDLLLSTLVTLREAIFEQAKKHQHTVMIGRSHGIHGEPVTFGLKLLVWVEELTRQESRLKAALEDNRIGQVSGAMGTYAHLSPEVETLTCQHLNLEPAKVSTQILQRDRHAHLMNTLALLASSLEKFAVEIRHLQRTDVLEVEEPFKPGQKGSSAMPHKRNPVASENMTGLARLVRSYAIPAMENVALWHERDISHSSVERVIVPDAFILLHYMMHRFTGVMKDLQVYPDNMKRNMNVYGGVIFSQRVLLKLIDEGVSREEAYTLVQRNAHAAWNTIGGDFKANLLADSDVTKQLNSEAIDSCFDPQALLKNVEAIFARF